MMDNWLIIYLVTGMGVSALLKAMGITELIISIMMSRHPPKDIDGQEVMFFKVAVALLSVVFVLVWPSFLAKKINNK